MTGKPPSIRSRGSHATSEPFLRLGGPHGKKYAEQLHQLATGKHDDPNVRIKALAIIAPYVWGKPVERYEHSGSIAMPLPVTFELHPAST